MRTSKDSPFEGSIRLSLSCLKTRANMQVTADAFTAAIANVQVHIRLPTNGPLSRACCPYPTQSRPSEFSQNRMGYCPIVGSANILLVEDETNVAYVASTALRLADYSVTEAAPGRRV